MKKIIVEENKKGPGGSTIVYAGLNNRDETPCDSVYAMFCKNENLYVINTNFDPKNEKVVLWHKKDVSPEVVRKQPVKRIEKQQNEEPDQFLTAAKKVLSTYSQERKQQLVEAFRELGEGLKES